MLQQVSVPVVCRIANVIVQICLSHYFIIYGCIDQYHKEMEKYECLRQIKISIRVV